MKHLLLLLAIFLSGCSSIYLNKNKFYIESEVLPVITNDKNLNSKNPQSSKILIERGKASYLLIYKF